MRRFVVIGLLGRGGFGTIYKAHYYGDGDFRKLVALKLLNPEVSGVPEIVARLRDEARILGLLRHRAVVGVDRLTQVADRWAVVMEYVEGVDLSRVIAAGPVPVASALEISAEVASALHVAWTTMHPDGYAIQLMHRDIKPGNIQLTAHGEVKVLDFGIARAMFSGREAHTTTGVPGTVLYMAPERMEMIDGPEADVYALGAVLFEMLTGERLGRTSPRPERHELVLDRARARLVEADQSIEIIEFVLCMLAFEPADRPTAEQCAEISVHLRSATTGEWLRSWSGRTIPELMSSQPELPSDGLTGRELVEAASTAPPDLSDMSANSAMSQPALSAPTLGVSSPSVTNATPGRPSALLALVALVIAVAVVGGGLAGAIWALRGLRPSEATQTTTQVQEEPHTPPAVDALAPAAPTPVVETTPVTPAAVPAATEPKNTAPNSTRTKSRPAATETPSATGVSGTIAAQPSDVCVPVKLLLDGVSSNGVYLEDLGTSKVMRSTKGCVGVGRYAIRLDCKNFPNAKGATLLVTADTRPVTADCDSTYCKCTVTQ